jgi:hypothetical protein
MLRFFFVASPLKMHYTKERAAPCLRHERSPNHKSPSVERRPMAAIDGTQKAGIYETLSSLNTAFAGIIQHLQTLQQTGLFKSKVAKLFPGFALELQAEFNQEFLESLHQLELDDWGRYGKVRQRWEKEIRDPDDVLLQAEERKQQLATQRKKRWHTLTN